MLKIFVLGTLITTSVFSQTLILQEPLCDKISLQEHQLNSEEYRDCKQIKYDDLISKDEELAYKIPNENCTKQQKQAKKEAIERLKQKGLFVKCKENKNDKLLSAVPDYENWSNKQIKEYENAKKSMK